MKSRRKLLRRICFVSVLFIVFLTSSAFAEKWGFVAIGDNRAAFSSYRNVLQEIKDRKAGAENEFPPADFVLAVGDIDPVKENHKIYKEVFRKEIPAYFPVRGNHEEAADVRFILQSILPSYGGMINLRKNDEVNYYVDWKNVRIIVLDQYSAFGTRFDDRKSLDWIEDAISSAKGAKHVFIAFHEPLLPAEGFNNPFWAMLSKHKATVRAVFCGHYHIYDRKRFPDEKGGIYYINVGNAGQISHSDKRQTMVRVMVDDGKVSFGTIQADDGSNTFKVREKWEAGQTD